MARRAGTACRVTRLATRARRTRPRRDAPQPDDGRTRTARCSDVPALRSGGRRRRGRIVRRPRGVNVIGYLQAELGLGEAARKLVAGAEAAGLSTSTVTYTRI